MLTRRGIGSPMPRALLAPCAACAAAWRLALALLLLLTAALRLAALACVEMGAACAAMRAAGDATPQPGGTAPPKSPPPEEAEAEEEEDVSPRLRFRLVPPAALSAAAAQPFAFGGELISPRRDGQMVLAVAADTPAEDLLDLCGHWLRVRPESLAVQGPRLTLTPGSPRRTVAQAGLGEPPTPPMTPPASLPLPSDDNDAAVLPVHSVFALPWCCSCLEAATGAVWSCRGDGPQRHSCCDSCARRYAATRLTLRSGLAPGPLRCPATGCPHTLLADRELWRLINTEEVRAAHAQRIMDQAERLRRVASGQEVRLRCMLGRVVRC